MKVIYTNATKFAGAGMGYTAYQIARGLSRAGHLKQAIVGYTAEHDLPTDKVTDFPWMKAVAWLAKDFHWFRDALFDLQAARHVTECDIFHGWSHQCLRSLRRAKELGAITFVERQNSHDDNQLRLLQEEFERWGYEEWTFERRQGIKRGLAEYAEADFITVPSPFAYNSMIAAGIPEEKLFLTPYGVDVERFQPPPSKPAQFRLLYVGQVCLRKGVPYLLQAWNSLNLPEAELWVAGRITPDARQVVASMAGAPSIRLLGHVRDTAAVYRDASAFICPSLEEGSALVTYEAMACGLPLIFTFNSGAVARDGVEGLQVPIRDAEATAAAIERLYDDAQLRREMGRAGRQRAEAYTWDAAADRFIAAYEEALTHNE